MSYRITAVAMGLGALILLPPIKSAYDSLVTTVLNPMNPNDITVMFFTLLPYGLLGLIVFGTIYKLFRGRPGEDGL